MTRSPQNRIAIFKQFAAVIILLLCLSSLALAQCSGTLGDPVVNMTFGTGIGPSRLQLPATTNLTYTTGCPDDGFYTVVNQVTTCYTNNWHNVIADHTGDTNGKFMLVNASLAPSDFFLQTVDGLCGGTTYQFGFWVMNMISHTGISPNIRYSVEKTDGTILQTADTNDIPISSAPVWKQFSFYFTLPTGVTSVVLRMRNNAPGGGGNDLALDDITFRPTGPAVKVAIPGHTGAAAAIQQSASSNTTLLATVDACYPKTAFQWQQSTDNGLTWADAPGGNLATYRLPALIPSTYQYRVLVADDGNTESPSCRVVSGVVTVIIVPDDLSNIILPPNAFTPNGDGINDIWNIPVLIGFGNCTVDIYSRNGRKVYHSVGYDKPWDGTYDGKLLPNAVYYYVIDIKNGSKPFSGYVSLL